MLSTLRRRNESRLARTSTIGYRNSFALNDLDKRLEPFLTGVNGIIIEAGANDGLQQSNSLYYEKYFDRHCVLIEPIPELFEACQVNRPRADVVHAALVDEEFSEPTLTLTYCGLMSSSVGAMENEDKRQEHTQKGLQFLPEGHRPYEVSAPARTLSSIIEEVGFDEIALLSLDVEGFESFALRGLDRSKHRPAYLLVETRHDQRDEICDLLASDYRAIAALTITSHHSDLLFASL